MEDIAFCDLKEESNYVWVSKEGHEAMRVMQLGLQYLLFIQSKLSDKVSQMQTLRLSQLQQIQKMEQIHSDQKIKMARYKKIKQKLNEQEVHFQVILNKMDPEILKERLHVYREKEEILADEGSVFHKILKAKGIIREFKDQEENLVSQLDHQVKENQEPNRNDQGMDMMMEIMKSLKNIQSQIDEIKKAPHQNTQIITQIVQQASTEADKVQDQFKKSKSVKEKSLQEIEKKSEEDDYKEDFEQQSEGFSRGSSLKDNEKIVAVEDIENSRASSNKSNKSRQKWDIQKVQKDQEIEQIIKKSQISDSSQISQIQTQKLQEENFKSPSRRSETLRKQQTPIKEEVVEESEVEEDIKEEPKAVEDSKNYELDSFVNEDYLKSSGLVVDSTSLKRKNEEEKKQQWQLQQNQSPSKKFNNPVIDTSANGNKEDNQSIPSEVNQEDEDDDYKDDDFEQESVKSGTNVQGTLSMSGLPPLAGGKVNKQQAFQGSIEDSQPNTSNKRSNLLPQDFNVNIAESQMSIDFDISDSKILPLNPMPQKKSTQIENLMRRKLDELEESGDYMDSNDFQFSESNFSQSFRSKEPSALGGKIGQKSQQQKKQFYFYEQQKFSSYNKNSSNNSVNEEEDDF